MKNVDMKLDGDILTIVVDIAQEFGLSPTGKSRIIATTEGNVSIPGRKAVRMGLNVYSRP
ncbi:MAG TPA: hypothetical protein PLB91_03880 [Spirochaetales bacterium]|nr:hypothetical protein [Spirochaetales bacterium]HRY55078.1 hypothetical protein [Spirochaetia bacterium]HRZ64928.1 hypothetical protein [Spirochaetia bacterium]